MSKRRVVRTKEFRVVITGQTADVYYIRAQCPPKNNLGRLLGTIWIDYTGAWNVQYEPNNTYLPINYVLKLLNYRQKTFDFQPAECYTCSMETKHEKGNDRCPLCGKPIDPYPGAVVYHMACMKKDMAPVREEINAENHPGIRD